MAGKTKSNKGVIKHRNRVQNDLTPRDYGGSYNPFVAPEGTISMQIGHIPSTRGGNTRNIDFWKELFEEFDQSQSWRCLSTYTSHFKTFLNVRFLSRRERYLFLNTYVCFFLLWGRFSGYWLCAGGHFRVSVREYYSDLKPIFDSLLYFITLRFSHLQFKASKIWWRASLIIHSLRVMCDDQIPNYRPSECHLICHLFEPDPRVVSSLRNIQQPVLRTPYRRRP